MELFYTDYPFTELGDTPGEYGPIRQVELYYYDGDKYCQVIFENRILEVKHGYLYKTEQEVRDAQGSQ